MFYVSGKCTATRALNHYWALHREIRDNDHAAMNYCKKYFRTQKSDKTAGFGSDIARIRIRQIRNSKVPIPTCCPFKKYAKPIVECYEESECFEAREL